MFLELFAGEGGITHAAIRKHIPCAPAVEIRRGEEFDLSKPGIRKLILEWILAGSFLQYGSAPRVLLSA